jgi:hypothetical protein
MNITLSSSQDLLNIERALEGAVISRIMAADYAKLVWKEVLKKAGLEVAKPVLEKKEVVK